MATLRIAESVGRVLGDRYRLTRPLGMGASAHVYVAEDVSLRRRVAIKVLHPALAGDEGFLRRFRAEAQVVAALRHPNILTVFDWGEDGGSPYLVTELLEGGSLRAMLDRGALLSAAQAASVGADAARALDYAHRRGLVHRDVKPANLIFDDEGRVRVADFGLARALAEATWTEPAGAVVGTARYAAPEQARGQKLDSRADVYSLALVLVEATTGSVPFASDTTIGTLMARTEKSLEVPDAAGPLVSVLEAAGTLDPASRLDASTLANRLDRIGARLPIPAQLSLAPPWDDGGVERDVSPTEHPGRPRLFDRELAESGGRAGPGWDETLLVADVRGAPGQSRGADPSAARLSNAAGDALRESPPGATGTGATGTGAAATGAAATGATRLDATGATEGRAGRRWSRRSKYAALLVALVLLLGGGAAAVVASGALVAYQTVPHLVGDTQVQAGAVLARLHLHLRVAGSRYDSAHGAGTVIQQNPASGKLQEGRTVSVVLSEGPKPVAVPTDLAGMTEAHAAAALESAGLKLAVAAQQSSMSVPQGSVISSSPDKGTLFPGQTVSVIVSTGKPIVSVPSLGTSGSASFAAAESVLSAAGLGANEVVTYSDTVANGHVISTDPAAGAPERVGTVVTVLVSKGPDLVPVPSVQGDSVTEASNLLSSDGFTVTGVSGSPTAKVVGTNPAQGTMVHVGAAIQLLTG